MSTLTACLIVAAVVLVGLASSYWHIRQAMGQESARDRIIREAHERAETARLLDPTTIARAAGPADPWQAGLGRLHRAVREEQQSGGETA
ncbi:hypothetical protein ABZ869_01445 [Streptomyces sp. NPDC046928]|uniref:hypothetical protein n=1 Tax=Streptomyces sp. NPDC046928 TaxID=3155021 RepID=UPI0033CDD4BB